MFKYYPVKVPQNCLILSITQIKPVSKKSGLKFSWTVGIKPWFNILAEITTNMVFQKIAALNKHH